jgi:hypothetical protein
MNTISHHTEGMSESWGSILYRPLESRSSSNLAILLPIILLVQSLKRNLEQHLSVAFVVEKIVILKNKKGAITHEDRLPPNSLYVLNMFNSIEGKKGSMSARFGSVENRILAAAAAALQLSTRLIGDEDDDDEVDNIVIDKFTSSAKKLATIDSERNTTLADDCDGHHHSSRSDRQLVRMSNNRVLKYTVKLKGGDNDSITEGQEEKQTSSLISSTSTGSRKVGTDKYYDARDDDGFEFDDDRRNNNQECVSSSCVEEGTKHKLESFMMTMVKSFQNPCGLSQSSFEKALSAAAIDPISCKELSKRLKDIQTKMSSDRKGRNRSVEKASDNVNHREKSYKDTGKDFGVMVCADDMKNYDVFQSKLRQSFTSGKHKSNHRQQKGIQFEEKVIVWQCADSSDRPSDDEKKDAWYHPKDFYHFQQSDKALAKQIRSQQVTSTACGLSNLLEDYEQCLTTLVSVSGELESSLGDGILSLDQETSGQQQKQNVCVRGLENYLTKQSKVACKERRKTIVKAVMKEQQNLKDLGLNHCSSEADLLIRKQALSVSKVSRQIAKKLATNDSMYVLNSIYPELIKACPQWERFLSTKTIELLIDNCKGKIEKDASGKVGAKKKENGVAVTSSPTSLSTTTATTTTTTAIKSVKAIDEHKMKKKDLPLQRRISLTPITHISTESLMYPPSLALRKVSSPTSGVSRNTESMNSSTTYATSSSLSLASTVVNKTRSGIKSATKRYK